MLSGPTTRYLYTSHESLLGRVSVTQFPCGSVFRGEDAIVLFSLSLNILPRADAAVLGRDIGSVCQVFVERIKRIMLGVGGARSERSVVGGGEESPKSRILKNLSKGKRQRE